MRCYLNSLYENPLMLQAEGGGLVPLINVSLPTVWERGQVWRWTKLFIYFLIVKQPGSHPQCFLYLYVRVLQMEGGEIRSDAVVH